jgi:pyruvate kinase
MNAHAEERHWARTKIVATVGPACASPEMLAALVAAGVDVFRLNMAHGGPEAGQPLVERIRQVSLDVDRPLAILVDLAGPKIRLGEIVGGSAECALDDQFFIVAGQSRAAAELTVTYEPLLAELSAGDVVMLADGTVAMRVEEVELQRARLRVVQAGTIRSRQGVNLPGVKLSAPALGPADRAAAQWAATAGADFISLSFVRTPEEVRELKEVVRAAGSSASVVAKIEKREALDRLEEIIAEADGVMVARGDLGVEIDVARVPLEQKRIIRVCQDLHKPAIIATQMLESMHDSPRPTRAEATDVANAILDGADACMLSGETAIGKFPREAVGMMNRIARATEESMAGRPPREMSRPRSDNLQDVTRAVVCGAGTMAHVLGAKLVVVASHSGRTALALSQQRSFVPTVGVSDVEATLRKMCLYWGVTPLAGAPATQPQELIRHADAWACAEGLAQPGDRVVIVGGSHLAAGSKGSLATSGVHDIVIVHEVEA